MNGQIENTLTDTQTDVQMFVTVLLNQDNISPTDVRTDRKTH